VFAPDDLSVMGSLGMLGWGLGLGLNISNLVIEEFRMGRRERDRGRDCWRREEVRLQNAHERG
jgi:hypothetical protein